MLHEQYIELNFFGKFTVLIQPFDWYFIFKKSIDNRGDYDRYNIWTLCFQIYFQKLSKKGREGKEYRKKLRESGEWTLKEL